MPYIERTGKKTIKEQFYQWFGVMTDPRIDGFNGFACKQKIYEIKWECERLLENEKCPTYAGEEEWIQEQKDEKAMRRLSGEDNGVPLVF